MSALKGSISVRRYAVLEPLPKDPRAKLLKGARAHAFLPLDPKSDVDRSVGWVTLGDADDADLSTEKLFHNTPSGEQVRLSMRVDTLKAPTAEVKRQVKARAQQLEEERGRPLARSEKRALQDEVARTLRLRAFPRVKTIDAVWFLDGQRVYLWSQAKGANEAFVDLFVKSFGLGIEVEGPSRWARDGIGLEALAKLGPTPELWQGYEGLRPLAPRSGSREEA